MLPAGLVGLIPTVPLCGEPQASKGECSPASQIGVATVLAAGFGDPVSRSPGMRLPDRALQRRAVRPLDRGARRGRAVQPRYRGDPLDDQRRPEHYAGNGHERSAHDRQGRAPAPEEHRRQHQPAGLPVQPDQLRRVRDRNDADLDVRRDAERCRARSRSSNCGRLAFKPSFKAATSAKTSKANGASLETTINQPAGQANIKSVLVQLPKQLPSRLTTLQKACPEKTFANDYNQCPPGSFVGGARANTPTLPGQTARAGDPRLPRRQAFPDLDLVIEANGVRVILVGNTKIKKGITTTNFATMPDVPVSSITVNLPIGAHSALTANGNLCANQLVMPTTITGQNGFKVKQNTKIAVTGCGVRIAGHKVIGNTAYITVQTFEAGRISGSGSNLGTVYRYLGRAVKTATLKVPLSRRGRSRGRPLRVRLRVGFVPKKHGAAKSAATRTVTFR